MASAVPRHRSNGMQARTGCDRFRDHAGPKHAATDRPTQGSRKRGRCLIQGWAVTLPGPNRYHSSPNGNRFASVPRRTCKIRTRFGRALKLRFRFLERSSAPHGCAARGLLLLRYNMLRKPRERATPSHPLRECQRLQHFRMSKSSSQPCSAIARFRPRLFLPLRIMLRISSASTAMKSVHFTIWSARRWSSCRPDSACLSYAR